MEIEGRPQSLIGPLVGVSATGQALLPVFLVLSKANKGDRCAFLEDGTQEILDGGTSSNSGSDAVHWREKRGRPQKTSLCLLLLGVAITWAPWAKELRTGFLGSVDV